MALKNMIKVGDFVLFGRGANHRMGTVVKLNPMTARIRVPRDGEFNVTYNLIRKKDPNHAQSRKVREDIDRVKAMEARGTAKRKTRAGLKEFNRQQDRKGRERLMASYDRANREEELRLNPASEHYHEGATSYKVGVNVSRARAAAKKAEAAAKAARAAVKKAEAAVGKKSAAKKPRQKAMGRKICAVPVAARQCAPKTLKQNPANMFTAKGERMYEAVKAVYGRDPRAKEIAARTVYKAAKDGVPGLVRKNLRPPGVSMPKQNPRGRR